MSFHSLTPKLNGSSPTVLSDDPTKKVLDEAFEIATIPGLVRMLLIDTRLFPGAISEVPLDGNTLVTGTNAAGKTSIIQLLPLFSGVSPSKISRKSQGKSFYGHYLPRSTSYVAFEYRHRDGGLRSVIVHAAIADDKPMFRFVRSGLFEDMFVGDDNEFVAAPNLASHLRNRGYQVADRIVDTLTDYQTIIQGLPIKTAAAKDRTFLGQMVPQYTMSQPGQPLLNLDRVVYSMLKKDVSLQALEEMIAENILQDDTGIQIESDRTKLEHWPSRYQSYQLVMDEEDAARKLQRQNVELNGYAGHRHAAIAELQSLGIALAQDETRAKAEKEKAATKLKTEQENYAERKEQLHEATSNALIAKNRVVDSIHDIEKFEIQGKAAGIETKVSLAGRKTQIETDRDEVQHRLTALDGEQSELTRSYDGFKHAAKEAADAEREIARNDEAEARDQRDAALIVAKARHADAEAILLADHETPINEADEAYDDARSELGAAREAAKSPQVSQETLNKRDEAQRAFTACSAQFTQSMQDERPLEAAVRTQTAAIEKVEREIAGYAAGLSGLKDTLSKLEASKKPRTGSLLAHLRQNRQDWGQNIGRVINPELLSRTDLNPQDIQFADGIFGLGLDLSGVESVADADLTEIDAQITEVKAEIGEVDADIVAARARLTKLGQGRASAQKELASHQGAQSVIKRQKASAETTLEKREEDVRLEREQAAVIAKARVEAATKDLEAARKRKDDALKARKDALGVLHASNATEIADIEDALKKAVALRKSREDAIKKRLADRLEELEVELASALKKKGIDASHLLELRGQVAAHEKDLASINRDNVQVQKWLHFLAVEMPKLPGLRNELAAANLAHEAAAAKEAEVKRQWREREQALKAAVEAAETAIKRIEAQLSRIKDRLARTEHASIPPSARTSRTLEEILAALNEAEKSVKRLESDIRTGVTKIAKVFFTGVGSPAEQHLKRCKESFSSAVEGPEWVPAIIQWYDELHEQHRDAIMNDGRTITNNIKSGYYRLIELDRQIRSENIALQNSLNRNNVIAAVEDLSVSITSSIKKLDFMPAMERLSNLHEEWMRTGQTLPPEGFTDAMTNLLTYWNGRDGIAANLRDQIKIEGYLIEKGNRRDFHAGTDMKDISSNGVSYLVLTTILVGFVNMVRGKSPVHIVWALDELGNIDAENTRLLLDMLRENHITLVAATPQAPASVNKIFDYRVKVIDGPRLADIQGAGRPSQRLLTSPASAELAYQSAHPAPTADKEV